MLQVVAETEDYKYNCSLVIIDFFIRNGFIPPDSPGYLELLASMRQGDCS